MIFSKAPYGRRILAWLIDIICLSLVAAVIIVPGIIALFSDAVRLLGIAILIVSPIVILGFSFWNSVFRQGKTGQTIGKRLLSTKLISTEDGMSVGVGPAFLRLLVAWALNAFTGGIFFIVDFLFPLFDKQGQRVVDKMLKTQVIMSSVASETATGWSTPAPITSSDFYG